MDRDNRKIGFGFTLAELLIVLTILGFISVLTVRNLLLSSQDSSSNAKAREASEMIVSALDAYQRSNEVTSGTSINDLTAYINYIKVDTTSVINDRPGWPSQSCTNGVFRCLRLHNGSILWYEPAITFGGTNVTNAIYFNLDPDAGQDAAYTGVTFFLYASGRMTTIKSITPGTASSITSYNPEANGDPSWLSWN